MIDITYLYYIYNIIFSLAALILTIIFMARYIESRMIRRLTIAIGLLVLLQNAGIGVVQLFMYMAVIGWIMIEVIAVIHFNDDEDNDEVGLGSKLEDIKPEENSARTVPDVSCWEPVLMFEPSEFFYYDGNGNRRIDPLSVHLVCAVFDIGDSDIRDLDEHLAAERGGNTSKEDVSEAQEPKTNAAEVGNS